MAINEKHGTIEKKIQKKWYEETHIEWKIPVISAIYQTEDPDFHYESPSFFINDVSCFLSLFPDLDELAMRMYITIDVEREFSPEYNISLKKLDGTLEHLVCGIPEKVDKTFFDVGNILTDGELLERLSELAPHDVLTIVCRFKRELADSSETPGETMPLKFIRIPVIIYQTEDPGFHYESPSFFINDVSCFLSLFPNLDELAMRMYITIDVEREFSPEYNISLKKLDVTVEHLVSGIPKKVDKMFFDMGDILKVGELQDRLSELAPHDVLTVVCRFKRELAYSSETPGETMPLKFIKLDKLSENFIHLFEEKETCDVTLKVKDKEYKAHRLVLIARSSVFAATFKHDTLERQTGVITISDCDPESFEVFLKYIYCGKLEEISCSSALNLYYTSDKYDVQELKTFCIEYLMQCLTVENLCEVAVFADKNDEGTLFSAVQDFFNENLRKIFVTPDWNNLMTTHQRLANKLLIEMSNVKHGD